jgi:hypothetical protein
MHVNFLFLKANLQVTFVKVELLRKVTFRATISAIAHNLTEHGRVELLLSQSQVKVTQICLSQVRVKSYKSTSQVNGQVRVKTKL